MKYEEMLDSIYYRLIDRPEVDMCGTESREALLELEKILDPHTYREMSDLFCMGFAENARNGFYYGFQCAAALMTGNQMIHTGGISDGI